MDNLRLPRKPDIIIHLAANARVHESVIKPRQALDNYLMTHNVLEFARKRGVSRVLFSSSREIYGESRVGKRRREDSVRVPEIKSPYTAAKLGAEALMHAYRECYGIGTVIARLSNVYGRYDVSERVIPLFMYRALRNRDIEVFGREKKLDFTYIDDCIDGLVRIVRKFDRVAGMTFNLSRGKGERLIDIARKLIDHLDSDSRVLLSRKRIGEISTFIGDIALSRKHLGYDPKVTLDEGLLFSIQWYRAAVKIRRIYALHRRALARWGWE